MVFIIGLGRSGTNLVGRILASHPNITCDIEKQPQFDMSVDVVVNSKPIKPLLNLYKSKQNKTKKIYATKDHVNIWLVEQLRILKPKFICIERDIYQNVSSSQLHPGVLGWITEEHPSNPLSGNYVSDYNSMDTVERLALRWIINHQRINYLKKTNRGDIIFLDYSDLVVRPRLNLLQLKRFLEVRDDFETPHLDKRPLTKYTNYLTNHEIEKIRVIKQKYENVLCLP